MKKKRTYQHFTNEELWSLDCTIAKFILPRLKRFKKHTNGYPGDLTEKKWNSILDKILFSFDVIAGDKMWDVEYMGNEKFWKTVQEGLDLFAERFNCLWW